MRHGVEEDEDDQIEKRRRRDELFQKSNFSNKEEEKWVEK